MNGTGYRKERFRCSCIKLIRSILLRTYDFYVKSSNNLLVRTFNFFLHKSLEGNHHTSFRNLSWLRQRHIAIGSIKHRQNLDFMAFVILLYVLHDQ